MLVAAVGCEAILFRTSLTLLHTLRNLLGVSVELIKWRWTVLKAHYPLDWTSSLCARGLCRQRLLSASLDSDKHIRSGLWW